MEIITFDELDSTNDYLKKNYNDYNDFTVIRAIKQTSGRGRFDREWNSLNDLTFSILFKKHLPHHFIAPLAIHNALRSYGIESTIKWPNDILIDDLKVSGILIERIFENKISNDIVGIGLNIEKRDDFTYLDKYKKMDIVLLLNEIINMYKFFASLDISELKRYYINKCSIINKEVIFNDSKHKVIGINNNAELILDNNDTINANEINYKTMIISK